MKSKIAVLGHMGLGDAIVQKGLVRRVTEIADEVLFFGKKQYEKSLQSLFWDVDKLSFVLVDDDADISPAFGADGRMWRQLEREGFAVVPLGYHSGSEDWLSSDSAWNRCLYKQLGIPPECMRTHFGTVEKTPAAADMTKRVRAELGTEYAVVHDDPKRDMVIDRAWVPADLPCIHVDDPRIRSDNVCDYLDLLEHATEVHCIDSCFALLADACIPPGTGPKRVVHATRGRPHIAPGLYRGAAVERHGM